MVLAAHITPLGRRLTATTVEADRFERPDRITFRLLRGPAHLTETFELHPTDHGTALEYPSELGTDPWQLGSCWGPLVARPWTRAVQQSPSSIQTEAERCAGVRNAR